MRFSKNSLFALFAALKSGCMTKRVSVTVPYSKINVEVLSKFYEKGLIATYNFDVSLQTLTVYLKFDTIGKGLLESLYWYSKPSRLISIKASELKILDTSFYFLIFTEKGLFFSNDLLLLKRGGILLCKFLR